MIESSCGLLGAISFALLFLGGVLVQGGALNWRSLHHDQCFDLCYVELYVIVHVNVEVLTGTMTGVLCVHRNDI